MSDHKKRYDKYGREEWRRWYKLKAWRQARNKQLTEHPLCSKCLDRGKQVVATVVHHPTAHKGVWLLFIDPANHESVCKPCHDGELQQIEKRGFSSRVGADGWPTDEQHPLYQKPGKTSE